MVSFNKLMADARFPSAFPNPPRDEGEVLCLNRRRHCHCEGAQFTQAQEQQALISYLTHTRLAALHLCVNKLST